MKKLKEEIFDDDEIIKTVNEIKVLTKEDKYRNDSIKDLRKDYPDETKKKRRSFT